MPSFDRTGPAGQGPRTGRGLGKCGRAKGGRRPDTDQGVKPFWDTDRPFGRGAGRSRGTGGGRGQSKERRQMS